MEKKAKVSCGKEKYNSKIKEVKSCKETLAESKKCYEPIVQDSKDRLWDGDAYESMTNTLLNSVWMRDVKKNVSGAKSKKLKCAFIYFNLDNFNAVYDIYGQNTANMLDEIIKIVESSINTPYLLFRFKTTEFAIFISDMASIADINEIVDRMGKMFERPIQINEYKFYMSVSIGVSVYPDNGKNVRLLLKKSMIAMRKLKEKGTLGIQCYMDDMIKEADLSLVFKRDLVSALENNELFLCYQPQIDIKTNEIMSVEALLRWRHPKMGEISPGDFIPIAEETGLIVPIGEWVLYNACKQFVRWQGMGISECRISVNASVIQLQQPSFAEQVQQILLSTGLNSAYLEIEITESIFIKSIDTVAKNLNQLKEQGIKVSIDDFGVNYCSLKYLKEFSINYIKIDKAFIRDMKVDVNKAIIDSIIVLAHRIGMEVIAEGVETKEQYDYLKTMGCDRVQGFYFYKPLISQKMAEVLKMQAASVEVMASVCTE